MPLVGHVIGEPGADTSGSAELSVFTSLGAGPDLPSATEASRDDVEVGLLSPALVDPAS
jgi:hypothetical protein